jgi:hypothetical protein
VSAAAEADAEEEEEADAEAAVFGLFDTLGFFFDGCFAADGAVCASNSFINNAFRFFESCADSLVSESD